MFVCFNLSTSSDLVPEFVVIFNFLYTGIFKNIIHLSQKRIFFWHVTTIPHSVFKHNGKFHGSRSAVYRLFYVLQLIKLLIKEIKKLCFLEL